MTITSKFNPGKFVLTRTVFEQTKSPSFKSFVDQSLARHLSGDWGDMDPEDKEMNEIGLIDGDRLHSAYSTHNDQNFRKIWIITEADRSVTTVLFPEEY